MNNRTVLAGSIMVAVGATSYGVLTTFVKMAYAEGFTTFEVTFSQLSLGMAFFMVLNTFYKGRSPGGSKNGTISSKDIKSLILAGLPFGLTSIFYYASVQYISVSLGIVLLLQSVWIGIVIDAFHTRKFPSPIKIIATVIILFGTLLATNIFMQQVQVNFKGIGFGLLAASSYATTIFVTNRVAAHLPAVVRSKWLLIGGFLMASLICVPVFIYSGLDITIFSKWGPILAFFGAVLPPFLLTRGMPKISVSMGAIISSFELPIAVLMAYFILGERVNIWQLTGIVLILFSIVLMNLQGESVKVTPKKNQK